MKQSRIIIGVVFFLFQLNYAQNFEELVSEKLRTEVSNQDFSLADISDVNINSYHYSKSTNSTLVYVQQQINQIPIFNSIGVFAIRNQEVVHFAHAYEANVENKINASVPSLSPTDAIYAAANQLGLPTPSGLAVVEARSTSHFIYNTGGISYDEIPVQLVFQKNKETNRLTLSWNLSIHAKAENNWWSVRIDAQTGELISQDNWTLSCTADHTHHSKIPSAENIAHYEANFASTAYQSISTTSTTDNAQYRVYPVPVESPNHGDRTLIVDPADEDASPFGWHDTDGIAGAEHTITRGNNVWAQEDRNGNNGLGYSPDGGEDLIFDFPLAFDAPPAVYEDAAITNLFYWNNIMHDVWYQYGFDEDAGNFQQTNYTGDGLGGDFVFADAQDGAGLNNATFATPPEGNHPAMTMFLWSPPGPLNAPLTIISPDELAEDIDGREANFGSSLSTTPINADLVLVDDVNAFGLDYIACGSVTNGTDINGKIAVVRRGECTFVTKVQNAQDEGALAVIVVNNTADPTFNMGGDSNTITIPSIMISQADGEELITALENGTTINATLVNDGPFEIDGDFDNGIIAHEFGHGISNRLTGGKFQSNCLFNQEQMGEGWSDYFGLVMTMTTADVATDGRGYGTYAISQPTDGVGIRPTPYSTDTTINPFTYNITNNQNLSRPHGIGYVWAQMLWDMTWLLIDEYGFDPDLYNGNGGNNIAMQLVTDGLKLQNCSPGFVDGRDAILAADELAFDGANQCIIWEAFASRGLGWSANQGDTDNRFDQIEAFDLPPTTVLDCETFSNTSFDSSEFKLWPNPAKNLVNIQLSPNSTGTVYIQIFSINGKEVAAFQKEASQQIQLNIDELNQGMYVVKIRTNETTFTEKLLVN